MKQVSTTVSIRVLGAVCVTLQYRLDLRNFAVSMHAINQNKKRRGERRTISASAVCAEVGREACTRPRSDPPYPQNRVRTRTVAGELNFKLSRRVRERAWTYHSCDVRELVWVESMAGTNGLMNECLKKR